MNALIGARTWYAAGYTGVNSRIAIIEANEAGGGTRVLAWNGHKALDGKSIVYFDNTGVITPEASGSPPYAIHGTAVAQAAAGKSLDGAYAHTQGVAPDASLLSSGINDTWQTYKAAFIDGVGPLALKADIANASYGAFTGVTNLDPTGFDGGVRAIDAILFVSGKSVVASAGNLGANGINTVTSPATGFNALTVGALEFGWNRLAATSEVTGFLPAYTRKAAFSSYGPSDFFIPNTANPGALTAANGYAPPAADGTRYSDPDRIYARARVDIAAPGANQYLASSTTVATAFGETQGTSFSAPTVAGGLALMVDYARAVGLATGGNAEAIDGRVLKAAVMNAAAKLPTWDNGQSLSAGAQRTNQALDFRFGAGALDLDQTFAQYAADEVTQNLPGLSGGTGLAAAGWDYAAVGRNAQNDYALALPLNKYDQLNSTLVWYANRSIDLVTGSTAEVALHNLDLEVWRLTGPGGTPDVLVGRSSALEIATEHLSFLIPQDGYYMVRVVRPNGATGYAAGANAVWDFSPTAATDTTTYGLAWLARSAQLVPDGSASLAGTTTAQNGFVGYVPGAFAQLSTSGTAAAAYREWLHVGGTPLDGQVGLGSLTVNGGGTVTVGRELRLYAGSRLTLDGGTLNAGSLTLDPGASAVVAASGSGLSVSALVTANTDPLKPAPRFLNNTGAASTATLGAGVVVVGGGTFEIGGSGGIDLNGGFSGTGTISKIGGGVVTVRGASSFAGTLTIGGGLYSAAYSPEIASGNSLLWVRTGGTLTGVTAITIGNNAELYADNAIQGYNANRVPNAAPVTLNGGRIRVSARSDSGVTNLETFGSLTVNGFGVITASLPTGAGTASTELRFGTLIRNDRATLFFRTTDGSGYTIGGGSPSPSVTNIKFATDLSTEVVGNTLGAGNLPTTSTGVIPWAVARDGSAALSTQRLNRPIGAVTYDSTYGIRVLRARGSAFVQAIGGAASGTAVPIPTGQNVNLETASGWYSVPTTGITVKALASVTTSITTASPATITDTGTLTVQSGLVLTSGLLTFSGPTLAFVGTTGYIHVGTGVTFSAGMVTGTNGLVLSALTADDPSNGDTGSGTVSFNSGSTNAVSGGLWLNGNVTLRVIGTGQLGPVSSPLTFGGGRLRYAASGSQTTARSVTFGPAGGTIIIENNAINLTLSGPYTGGGGGLIKDGLYSSEGLRTDIGLGTLTLSPLSGNIGGPTTVKAGTLAVTVNSVLSESHPLLVTGPGVLQLNGTTQGVGSIELAGVTASGFALAGSGTMILNGSFTSATPGAGVGAGVQPNLNLGGGVRSFDIAAGTGTPGYDVRVDGNVTNGGMNKVGTGVLQLAGTANNLTAGLTVNQGEVNLALNSVTAGPVRVQGVGALTGVGTASGTLAVTNQGLLSPGTTLTAGTLIVGAVSFTDGKYLWNVESLPGGGAAGTNWDLLALSGTFTVAGGNPVFAVVGGPLDGWNPNATSVWQVAGGVTGVSGSLAAFTIDTTQFANSVSAGSTFTLSASGDGVYLTYLAVPEPTLVLLVPAVVGLVGYARRRMTAAA